MVALRVLLPFCAGYFLSYLYRTVNAVLGPEIAASISLDSADLGLMTGAYFLAFGAFQFPLGILLDRFGPRRVEAALLLFAALGAAAFALAQGPGMLVLGRALVGFGVSACLMAALKANVLFFPLHRLPLLNGIVLAAGGLGAVSATAPVQAALSVTDWRGIYGGLAMLTVAAALALFVTVPERGHTNHGHFNLLAQIRDIGTVLRDRTFMALAPVTMLTMGTFMAVQGLWAGPWLRDVAHLPPSGVAAGLMVMAAAMAAGFLIMGAIADKLARWGISATTVALAGMAVFWLAGLVMALGVSWAPMALAALYGLAGTSATLVYAILTRSFPPHLAGRVNTSINLAIFATAFCAQWGLGAVIGLWPLTTAGTAPAQAYGVAFGIPVALAALSFLWFMAVARTSPASGK